MNKGAWITASKETPCKNCGSKKWCRESADGNVMICQHQPIPGGIEKTDKNNEIYWQLTKKYENGFVPYNKPPAKLATVANVVDRSRVYNFLLDKLNIEDHHAKTLIDRGLSAEHIHTSKFRTLPIKGRNKIYQTLEQKFGADLLETIPGIIKKDGRLCLGGAAGILIPVYDAQGRIVALLIRPDRIIDGNKYLWLSSGSKDGPSSGRHIHVPLHTAPVDVVHITEGALKAEVSTELYGTLTIGLPGVNGHEKLVECLTELNVKSATLVFDADAEKNTKVATALLEVFDKLTSANINVSYKFWDLKLAKGFDDALLAKVEIKTLSGDEARTAITQLPSLNKPEVTNEAATENIPQLHHGMIQMRTLIEKTWEVINASNTPPTLFRKGSFVVILSDDGKRLQIIEVDQVKMFGHLVRIANWYEDYEKSYKGVAMTESEVSTPPKDLVKDLLSYVDEKLPQLISVLEAPTFGKNGKLISAPGYDADNGIYLDPQRLLQIPEIVPPNKDELSAHISFLRDEVFGDFPFATESDFCHLLALLLTGVLRETIDGPVPLFVLNATSPGSGKSLIAELVSIILTGYVCEARAIPKGDDEIRKSVTSELMRGPRLILFDNADQEADKIHSPTLAAVLTSTVWTDRVLTKTKMVSLENRAIWVLTGNNVQLTSELFRRSVHIKLEPQSSKPWERQSSEFKHENIKAWVLENRATILASLLTIGAAWIDAGCKPSARTLGSFETWAKIVGGTLEHSNVVGFLDSKADHYSEADSEMADWDDFVRAWWTEYRASSKKVSDLFYLSERHELLSGLLGSGSDKSRQTKLGIELKNKNGRIFGNYRVKLVKNSGGHGKFYSLESMLSEVTNEGYPSQLIENTNSMMTQGDLGDLFDSQEDLEGNLKKINS